MKVVAVSQRVDNFPERSETRDALDQRLVMFLTVGGVLPVPVPNGLHIETPEDTLAHDVFDAWLSVLAPQEILLSGGNDIGAYRERDLTEGWLLDYAYQHRLPVLGICRGMQMMAHWAGTRMRLVQGHIRTRHQLSGVIRTEVNSYHSFSLTGCPEGFEVLAKSEDGEIEAIRHRELPWEGWMWHPERETNFSDYDIQRLRDLFDA